MKRFEWEFFDKENNGLDWHLFWIYDIIIFCFIIISIIFYYFHSKYYSKKSEVIEIESDELSEEKGKIYRNFSLGTDEQTE